MPRTTHNAQTQLFVHRRLDESELRSFAENGYLCYGQSLNDEGLERMRGECMAAWRAEKGDFDPGGTWLKNALLVNIHHRSDVVRRFYFSGPMVDVAEQVIGPNIKAATSQLTFKMRGNHQPFPWHQDNSYGELDPYNAISCLTALDDADEENGCLRLIPGSHRRGQIPLNHSAEDKTNQKAVELDADDTLAIPMPLAAGETLFFHCHVLHMSEGNRSRTRDRRIVFMRYADANAVEVYNNRAPRLGRLVRGQSRFPEVRAFEAELALK